MALTGDTLTAVIAGSVAGVIVFLTILASILYCCVRRRRALRKSEKPFHHRHLTPDTSLSKNSGPPQQKHGDPRLMADPRLDPRLDPRIDPRIDPRMDPRFDPRNDPRHDPRLPKVGSNSLWFGAPSLYSGVPSQAYSDMKRKPNTRPIDQPGLPAVPPGGHMIYQGANMSRIYHSQQVVPSMYDSEYRIARSGSYMDLYSYPYNYDPYRDISNSRAMLVSYPEQQEEQYLDRYRDREVRRTGKKVKRSQSDVTLHSTRRPKNRKQRKETPFDRESQNSTDDKEERRPKRSQSSERELQGERTTVADVHRPKKPAPPPPKQNREETQTQSNQINGGEMTESATDSAKLRALERERERNKENERDAHKRIDDFIFNSDHLHDNKGFIGDNGEPSDLNVRPYNYVGKPSKYESSAVAKMAALADTPKATYITRQSISGNINETPVSKEAFHAEVSKKLEKLQDMDVPPLDIADGPVATSTGNHSRSSRPQSAKSRRRSRRGSTVTDQDGNVVTQEAFEFLDGYSDGEGTDFLGSGSITPTLVRDYDINL